VNPDNYDLKQIPDTDMKRVEALKKAISEGNYTVPAEDLAPKLLESVFRSNILDEDSNGRLGSKLKAGDQAASKGNGGAMVDQNGSRSTSVPCDVAATRRESL
jgi:Anti-sigma-28 factor, FlgM